jgi:hypothetical protein
MEHKKKAIKMEDAVILFRPAGPEEMELVKASGFRRWPARLPDQSIFYPVTNEEYATQIARDWNVPASGSGYVTRFKVNSSFMKKYPIQKVGGENHTEWWIPAQDLEALNNNIVGLIEIVREFHT